MAATAAHESLTANLESLAASSLAASAVVPAEDSTLPPDNGISLLDAKNELFLTYLQSLALRNLHVIRSVRKFLPRGKKETENARSNARKVQDDLVQSLIRHRVYLEKGVRPLEDRLKYTIDKTLRAATEDDKKAELKQAGAVNNKSRNGKAAGSDDDDDDDERSSSEEEEEQAMATARPNLTRALEERQRPREQSLPAEREKASSGAYRPPRVTATAMPDDFDRRKRREPRQDRSRTMDEYVSHEMSEAPVAQASVGSMIAEGGRRQISARERAKEAEKREYEETHLTRLMEKKEKGAKRMRDGGFGGEDWRGLGDGLDRIDSLTRGAKRGSREGALEKSRKRRATEDGQRGDGVQQPGGGLFEKRKKRMMSKMR